MFRFKQFDVEHDRSSMKVGTDGVLLGAWCDIQGAKRALDVGTGSGLIAMMMAQRNLVLDVDAIDIDHDSVVQASSNFENCQWGERLRAIEGDYVTFQLAKKYDIIVSNPPFFNNGVLPPATSRMNARHTVTLTYDQLLAKSKSLLADSGKIAIVSPADCADVILEACGDNKLYVSKMVKVFPVDGKPAKRILWEIMSISVTTTQSSIVIRNHKNEFTEEYRELCKDFYLEF